MSADFRRKDIPKGFYRSPGGEAFGGPTSAKEGQPPAATRNSWEMRL